MSYFTAILAADTVLANVQVAALGANSAAIPIAPPYSVSVAQANAAKSNLALTPTGL